MSMEDVQKLYDMANSDRKVLEDIKAGWSHMQTLQKKYDLNFTFEEYFDYMHEHLGMTKVEKSDHPSHDKTDTCAICVISEPPR